MSARVDDGGLYRDEGPGRSSVVRVRVAYCENNNSSNGTSHDGEYSTTEQSNKR